MCWLVFVQTDTIIKIMAAESRKAQFFQLLKSFGYSTIYHIQFPYKS